MHFKSLHFHFISFHFIRRWGMVRILKRSHSFTCTRRVYPLTEWTIPAFAFSAEAGTHLPTPEGWKAEIGGVRWQCRGEGENLTPCAGL